MNVLQINAIYGDKSTGRTTLELAEYLEKAGHNSFVAYFYGNSSYKNSYKFGTLLEKKMHSILSRLIGLQGYFSYFGTKSLIKYIKTTKPDIVHLRVLHSNCINFNMILKFLGKKNIPTVITLHDCFYYTGKCFHYTKDNCYKWQNECSQCTTKLCNPSWFFDFSKKMLHDKKKYFGKIKNLAVIGVSDWITNEAKKSILKSAKIITKIYNWVDLDVFKPVDTGNLRKELGLENKFIVLGMANKWLSKENYNNTLRISENLNDNIKILLIGCQHTTNLPKNIIGVPYINDVNTLARYFSLADCFVNLSFEDTFGKVVAEALACGTPAIVYNSTALPELIGENCGYVVEINDIDKILECIYKIKNNTKQYYLDYCLKYTKENFDKTKNIDKMIDIYNTMIRDRSN